MFRKVNGANRDYGEHSAKMPYWHSKGDGQFATIAVMAAAITQPTILMLDDSTGNATSGQFVLWDGSIGKTLGVIETDLDTTASAKKAGVTLSGRFADYLGVAEHFALPTAITNADDLAAALLGSRFSIGTQDSELAA